MSPEPAVGSADVLVTENVWGRSLEALAGGLAVRRVPALPAEPADLAAALGGVRALVVRNRTRVDAALLDAAPDLLIVARAGVGLDNIDLAAADARGVVVAAPLGANAHSVAELTVGLALDLARSISRLDRAVRAGRWDREPGRELRGRTWGVLGAGATGRAVAGLAAAFGMKVLGYDPYVAADAAGAGITLLALDEVLAGSDVVSVHLPATAETVGLIDADRLARLRRGALLINVARGEIVVEDALLAALRSGALAGAALDVRAVEPPSRGELETLDNVVLTPHVAGLTEESQDRITAVLAADISRVLAGDEAQAAVGALRRPVR